MKNLENEFVKDGLKLPLVEDFYTIQGEGYHTGKAAYFIRLGGCDIGCQWCDTKFAWHPNLHKLTDIKDIIGQAKIYSAKSIVVTGGEPLNYNLGHLCTELKKLNIKIYLETSGVGPLTGNWDWICLSPKKHNTPNDQLYNKAKELKVIINNEQDFIWAEECSKKVNKNCKLFLQPEWSKYENIIPEIINYVKENTKWSISLQSQKFMHIP